MTVTGSSIATRLTAMIAEHETQAGHPPTTAVLPGRLYYELKREISPWLGMLSVGDIFEFDGVRIERRRPSISAPAAARPLSPASAATASGRPI